MNILTVPYAFAPLGLDSAGGAEQVAAALDRGIVNHGWQSIVIAAASSTPAGELVPIDVPAGEITPALRATVHDEQRRRLSDVLAQHHIDIVHLHDHEFAAILPAETVPVLVTLHLPLEWYPPYAVRLSRPATYLNCVSQSQHERRPMDVSFLPPIENGVPVERFRFRTQPGRYALCLGRICEEKGFHLGIRAARRAGVPAIIAGRIHSYPAHEAYFARILSPELDSKRRYIGPADFIAKRKLLAAARCLLVCSTVPETSSLVAMEALASGTPVIAFRTGALRDIVEHGQTGYIVDSVEEMADAIHEAECLDRYACRYAATARFGEHRMVAQYLSLYSRISGHVVLPAGTAA